jgi:hypothetical protein
LINNKLVNDLIFYSLEIAKCGERVEGRGMRTSGAKLKKREPNCLEKVQVNPPFIKIIAPCFLHISKTPIGTSCGFNVSMSRRRVV